MNHIIGSAETSVSAMYGNVNKAIEEIIIQRFPKNFFNYKYTSTEIGYRTLRKWRKYNLKNEIMKRQKPFIIIQPTYPTPGDDLFLYNTPITTNWMDQFGINPKVLTTVIKDVKNCFYTAFRLSHERLEYECKVVVSTMHQAFDQYHNLLHGITWDKTFYHQTSLESIIPRPIVGQMAKLMNIDLMNPAYTGAFLSRLNANGLYPITYKMKAASQSDEFFVYYTHNLLVTFTDLEKPNVTKKNFADDYWEFRFRVSVQFNMPSVYYVIGTSAHVKDLQISVRDIDTCLGDDTIIPIYTLQNVFSIYPPELNGKKYFANLILKIDPTDEDSTVDISDILREPDEPYDIHYILKQAHINNENIKTYLSIYLYYDGELAKENEDYSFNEGNFTVKIKKINSEYTYRLLIYLDMSMINSRKERCYEAKAKNKKL